MTRLRGLPVLCVAVVLAACAGATSSGPPSPIPARFVLAWIAPGGAVDTMESADGAAWGPIVTHATTPTIRMGPAIANDGALTWLLMWPEGQSLRMLGGAAGDSSPIHWDANPGPAIRVSLGGSPALTYGSNRWVAAFRDAAGSLEVVRSQPLQPYSWEAPVTIGSLRLFDGSTIAAVTNH